METQVASKWVLPATASEPTKAWVKQKFLMIGAGKIGKSSFWAQDEGAFFIETEPGLNHLAVRKLPCRSWDDLREIYAVLYEAYKAGLFPYQTLVIDTIDRLISYSQEECVQRAKVKFSKMAEQINTIGDIPEGVGWFWSTQMVDNMLTKLSEFPSALVLIGHVQNKEVKEPTRVIHKDTINIGGQMGTGLLGWPDHTLHWRTRMRGEAIERCLRTKPSEELEAGSRGNIVPDGFRIDGDLKAAYGKFRSLFTD